MRRVPATACFLSFVLAAASPSPAQEPVTDLADRPDVQRALEWLREAEPETVEEQIALCEIPAPPFGEDERAEAYRQRLEAIGLERVRIDAEGNVIAERPGAGDGPTVVLSAHLDTVFPEGTDVTVRREDGILHGPGIADDCRGLAIVLAVARALDTAGIETAGDLLFVGTVGEEGRGDLRGVRHLFEDELAGRVDAFVSIDGSGLDVTKDAVGSRRYEVVFRGPGGHSWGDFGLASPIHALGRAVAAMTALEVGDHPKTTFNVGSIEGGTSVNSIAFEARMRVDLRSVDADTLSSLDERFRRAVEVAVAEENSAVAEGEIEVEFVSIGIRPAGSQADDAPIVRAAVSSAAALGFTPDLQAGSTDSNLPISLGVPAVTIDGGGRSEGAHSPDEWFDPTDAHLGAQWALLFALELAGTP